MQNAVALLLAFLVPGGSARVIDIPWRVAFVGGRRDALEWGSFRMRGIDMAAAFTNASYGGCDIKGRFEVYVHVKYLCPNLLQERTSSAHIYDVVDSSIGRLRRGRLDGVIMGTNTDIRKNCRKLGAICARIPHHVNHNCTPRRQNWPLRQFNGKYVIGVLGTSNYTYLYKDLQKLLPNYEVLLQNSFSSGLCEFYDNISLALLWVDNFYHTEIGIRKPPTRMTNTARVNIPMVATSTYAAYHLYDPENKFLCADLPCIKTTVEAILKGMLRSDFVALKKRADKDTSSETIVGKYQRLFRAVVQRKRDHSQPS